MFYKEQVSVILKGGTCCLSAAEVSELKPRLTYVQDLSLDPLYCINLAQHAVYSESHLILLVHCIESQGILLKAMDCT